MGNVKIRDLVTCNDVTYLQVPPDEIVFANNILTACDPASLTCYHPQPLNCACVPTVATATISVGGSNAHSSTFTTTLDENTALNFPVSTSINVLKTGSAIYIAFQLLAPISAPLTASPSPPTVVITGNNTTTTLTLPDKHADSSDLDAYVWIFHLDGPLSPGSYSITGTITFTLEGGSGSTAIFIVQAAEIQNTSIVQSYVGTLCI